MRIKTAHEFIDYVSRGREIEISVGDNRYFATNHGLDVLVLYSMQTTDEQCFSSGEELFEKSILDDGTILKDSWDKVVIEDIF